MCLPNAHDTIGCENAPAAAVKTALRRDDHERRIGDKRAGRPKQGCVFRTLYVGLYQGNCAMKCLTYLPTGPTYLQVQGRGQVPTYLLTRGRRPQGTLPTYLPAHARPPAAETYLPTYLLRAAENDGWINR